MTAPPTACPRPSVARAAVVVLAALPALAGCVGDRPPPSRATAEASGRPALAEDGYLDLSVVPPRPKLSYSVGQREALARELVRDRANARYLAYGVRRGAGMPGLPASPPPPPPPPEAVEAAAPRAVETTPRPGVATVLPERQAPNSRPFEGLNEGGSDDFDKLFEGLLTPLDPEAPPADRPTTLPSNTSSAEPAPGGRPTPGVA